jgi:hypothetical protein
MQQAVADKAGLAVALSRIWNSDMFILQNSRGVGEIQAAFCKSLIPLCRIVCDPHDHCMKVGVELQYSHFSLHSALMPV